MSSQKPHILLMGQTPPPWHGQAVATQILFDHDWPGFEIHRLRMEYSEEMLEVGRFQWKKLRHLFHLIREARRILKQHPGCVLFYPPASAKWIPFLRDIVFLANVRYLAGATVFIYHASGLPVFANRGIIRKTLARLAYQHADVSLEVAKEIVTPHETFAARSWRWCPCGIDVPLRERRVRPDGAPMTVLFVGSLQEGKGVGEVLKTASILKQQGRERDFRFRLVGKWFSTDFEQDIRHLRSELEVEDMVELVGQLTGDAKWDAYFGADVFFFPTHYESEATPIVLMEALGAGLPVVTTEWAGIPAMLEGCESAWLRPVRSPDQYAAALADIRSQRHEQEKTSETSRAFYREHFLPARFIERVENAFIAAGGPVLRSPAAQCFGESVRVEQGKPVLQSPAVEEPVLRLPADRCFSESVREERKAECEVTESSSPTESPKHRNTELPTHPPTEAPKHRPTETPKLRLSVYLADQNPGHDRSFGISRMSQVVLETLLKTGGVGIEAIVSRTSQQAPEGVDDVRVLPWGTRRKTVRLLTDHFHPLFHQGDHPPDLYYFPKGYLPWLSIYCRPSVVTIHDTIIQYDEDHYPRWRSRSEYGYWAKMLKHTLRHADRILTVSGSSKRQIEDFMERHRIPAKAITVTYEPCAYEQVPQPNDPAKENFVIHLASVEPHKRTAHLIRWWHEAEARGRDLPMLHLIGTVPPEAAPLLASSRSIVKRPFLDDSALQAAYQSARTLILPSEIEGFGLPALEAYYLGTPVCFVKGTSVEEILGVATSKGGFSLDDPESLFSALDEVTAMTPDEVRECGSKLRKTYAAERVAERMLSVFREVKN